MSTITLCMRASRQTRRAACVNAITLFALVAASLFFCEPAAGGVAKARHVVLVVWDGMRPDFVTEANAPTLWRLAQSGVTFRNHHSIYPSLTSVNSAALATGLYPNRNGVIANWDFRPALDQTKLARLDSPEAIRRGDTVTGGKYLTAPTIAELLQAKGERTAVAGTKTAALLHDRGVDSSRHSSTRSVTVFAGETIPQSALAEFEKAIGKFPVADQMPNTAQDEWTTRALTESLWAAGVPRFSVLWMSDPDRSQHATSPGSVAALAAIKSVDANLARVLRALDEKGVRAETDVLIVSDHGFSTVRRSIDVADWLRKKGFDVASPAESTLARGRIKIAGNGGSDLFYVGERDRGTVTHLVEALQQSDYAGVLFSRVETEGAFPLTQIHGDTASCPDVVMSFRWAETPNENGVAGMIDSNGIGGADKGTHGTLSPFDLHNLFVAAGPDFARGLTNETPTSNLDVAATIISILGIEPPQPLDGRIISEALSGDQGKLPTAKSESLEASRQLSAGVWRQHLKTSVVGASVYLDEGDGEFRASAPGE